MVFYRLKLICRRCHLMCTAFKNVHTFIVVIDGSSSSWTVDLPSSLIGLTSVILSVVLNHICHSICLLDVSRLPKRVRCQINWLVEQAVEGLCVGLEWLAYLWLCYSQLLEQSFEDGDMKHVTQVHHASFRFKVKLKFDLLKFKLSQESTFRGRPDNDLV